ncbi:hypothetical protein G6F68_015918 [Rhizopus microsporus]|nr:hypothetical protein G6F68_015918 [Rhizopus microsporus]
MSHISQEEDVANINYDALETKEVIPETNTPFDRFYVSEEEKRQKETERQKKEAERQRKEDEKKKKEQEKLEKKKKETKEKRKKQEEIKRKEEKSKRDEELRQKAKELVNKQELEKKIKKNKGLEEMSINTELLNPSSTSTSIERPRKDSVPGPIGGPIAKGQLAMTNSYQPSYNEHSFFTNYLFGQSSSAEGKLIWWRY